MSPQPGSITCPYQLVPVIDDLEDKLKSAQAAIASLARERDIFKAGFIKANEFCIEYAVQLHIRGGALKLVEECVAARRLLDGEP